MSKAKTSKATWVQEFVIEDKLQTSDSKRAGTLQVKVELDDYEPYEACRRLEVTISQKLGRARKWTEIGYMVAFLVDKRIKAQGKNGKKDRTGLWIDELMKQDDLEGEDPDEADQTHGVGEASRVLFTKTGTVRAQLKKYQQELSSERFVFIDNYEKYAAHHVKGSGQQPMKMFLELLPQVLSTEGQEDAPQVPCILSPARSASVEMDNAKTDLEVEKGLIKAYQKNDFDVWLQADPDEENGITIMGRMV
jgi:hypothetical protein